MAKRFTDTDKWKHPSFRKLNQEAKLAWIYVLDNCDHAGVLLIDYELASATVGFQVCEKFFKDWFGDKLYKLDENRLFIPSFLEFQYGKLNESNSKGLVSAFKILNKFGIDLDSLPEPLSKGIQRVSKLSSKAAPCLKTKTTTTTTTKTNTANLNFEALYQKYPRKEGKAPGIATCKVQIRTDEDYVQLSKAIDRYIENIKQKATEPKFIKHFSTFMSSWRDWLDPETGSVIQAKPKNSAEQMAEYYAKKGLPVPK